MIPLVSTVLCSYNQAEFLRDAIESVLTQSYQRLELIVVDNGSTDGSHELLKEYATDQRVTLLLNHDNEAVTRRLNQGVAVSSGDFISILYADDYYLPDKFARQVECFAGLPQDYGVVYSPGYRLNIVSGDQWLDASMRVSGDILKNLLLEHSKGYVNPISPLIRRICLERYPFDESLFVEGESINLRFAMTFKYKFLDEPLVVMREHSSNIGKAISGNMERLMIVLDRLKTHPDFPGELDDAVEVFRSRVLRDCGWQGIRVVGDTKWARSCFKRSISAKWNQAIHPRTIAGFGLSLLPQGGRNVLNKIGNQIRRNKAVVGNVEHSKLNP